VVSAKACLEQRRTRDITKLEPVWPRGKIQHDKSGLQPRDLVSVPVSGESPQVDLKLSLWVCGSNTCADLVLTGWHGVTIWLHQ
jgi:hypothetical protein